MYYKVRQINKLYVIFMNFGNSRESTKTENAYEEFLVELHNEYTHIQLYFADLFNYSKEKQKAIEEEFLNENPEIKSSILQQPNYSLYSKKFDDLLAKSIIVTLISNFEFNLINLIDLLINEGYIKDKKFKKPSNAIIRKCLNFIYENSSIQVEDFGYETFEIFIKLRNSIIHNNSEMNEEISGSVNYPFYSDFIHISNKHFYFKDMLINYHLTKTLRTFFNSLMNEIK